MESVLLLLAVICFGVASAIWFARRNIEGGLVPLGLLFWALVALLKARGVDIG